MRHTPETAAAMLADSGYSFLMLRIDGSKRPIQDWKTYQSRQPTPEEAQAWFGIGKCRGIGAIMGAVSGNAEAIDFADLALFEPFCQMVEEKAPGLIARLVRVDTPRPGRQLVYRCAVIGRNQKLAAKEVPATQEQIESRDAYQNDAGEWLHAKTLIETRGEGGYIVAVGSPPRVHSTKRPYTFGNLDYSQVPTITPEEREILLEAARGFDEIGTPEEAEAEDRPRQRRERKNGELLPGDDFNERGDVASLLTSHGWTYAYKPKFCANRATNHHVYLGLNGSKQETFSEKAEKTCEEPKWTSKRSNLVPARAWSRSG
jgi:putative DNA primase/helicase